MGERLYNCINSRKTSYYNQNEIYGIRCNHINYLINISELLRSTWSHLLTGTAINSVHVQFCFYSTLRRWKAWYVHIYYTGVTCHTKCNKYEQITLSCLLSVLEYNISLPKKKHVFLSPPRVCLCFSYW